MIPFRRSLSQPRFITAHDVGMCTDLARRQDKLSSLRASFVNAL